VSERGLRVALLHGVVRKEEKLLLDAFRGFPAIELVAVDDRDLTFSPEARFDFDAVLCRSVSLSRGLYARRLFEAGGLRCFNPARVGEVCGDKLLTSLALERAKVTQPEFRVAFDAWIATDPFENPDAPPGPQAMPEYVPTGLADSRRLDAEADALFTEGHEAAETSDNYVRTTVILASVLFLVGISTHFPLRGVRYGLIAVGGGLLVFAGVLILRLPPPP